MRNKTEISAVGAVAGHMKPLVATFDSTSKRTPAQDKEIKKRKKIMNKTSKPMKFAPYNIDEQSHAMIRDTVFDVLIKETTGGDRTTYVMNMFDGINKQIALSMGYAKTFIVDALKMGELKGAKVLSFRRARTELGHMQKLIDDMQALVNKIHDLSDQSPEPEEAAEEGIKSTPGVSKKARGAVGYAQHSRQGTGAARQFNKGVRQAGKKQIRSGE